MPYGSFKAKLGPLETHWGVLPALFPLFSSAFIYSQNLLWLLPNLSELQKRLLSFTWSYAHWWHIEVYIGYRGNLSTEHTVTADIFQRQLLRKNFYLGISYMRQNVWCKTKRKRKFFLLTVSMTRQGKDLHSLGSAHLCKPLWQEENETENVTVKKRSSLFAVTGRQLMVPILPLQPCSPLAWHLCSVFSTENTIFVKPVARLDDWRYILITALVSSCLAVFGRYPEDMLK